MLPSYDRTIDMHTRYKYVHRAPKIEFFEHHMQYVWNNEITVLFEKRIYFLIYKMWEEKMIRDKLLNRNKS